MVPPDGDAGVREWLSPITPNAWLARDQAELARARYAFLAAGFGRVGARLSAQIP